MKVKEEQRAAKRFPIRQDVVYRVRGARSITVAGAGKTLNISSAGVLFTTEQRLTPDRFVDLEINWPVLLDGSIPLKLVVWGRIIWCDEGKAAVKIRRHEFRTQASEGLKQLSPADSAPKKPVAKALEANRKREAARRGGR